MAYSPPSASQPTIAKRSSAPANETERSAWSGLQGKAACIPAKLTLRQFSAGLQAPSSTHSASKLLARLRAPAMNACGTRLCVCSPGIDKMSGIVLLPKVVMAIFASTRHAGHRRLEGIERAHAGSHVELGQFSL